MRIRGWTNLLLRLGTRKGGGELLLLGLLLDFRSLSKRSTQQQEDTHQYKCSTRRKEETREALTQRFEGRGKTYHGLPIVVSRLAEVALWCSCCLPHTRTPRELRRISFKSDSGRKSVEIRGFRSKFGISETTRGRGGEGLLFSSERLATSD